MQNSPTPEIVKLALGFISPNLPRNDWVKMLSAVKSEFDDDAGLEIVTDWSSAGENYSHKSLRDTWKSLKASGGVTIASLFFEAKANGFVQPTDNKPPAPANPELTARMEQERAEKQQAENLETQTKHEGVALEAELLWNTALLDGASGYLTRKGISQHNLRFAADGCLLVPMRDADGKLWNLQRIFPSKPKTGTDKLFLKGGRKTGLMHLLGEPSPTAPILVAEGFATAASLYEITGRPVAVAFDAGNLKPVAIALRKKYQTTVLVICGDDDRQTFAEKGFNPGRDKATAAAQAVDGLAIFPENLPEGYSDFNDLHQTSGYGAVAAILSQIDYYEPPETPQKNPKPAKQKTRKTIAPPVETGADLYDPFSVDEHGVFFVGADQDGKRKPPEWLCSRLDIESLTRDKDGGGWGYFVRFNDPLGNPKSWAMPAKLLGGDGSEYRMILLAQGLKISTSSRARNLLTTYIQTRNPTKFSICTDRIGWHGQAFVLPRQTFGETDEKIVFQSESAIENTWHSKGDANQWRARVGSLCSGNSRLIFAVACSFAAPLLRPLGMESGGFHFRGDSSTGKSTLLRAAASVNGGPSYLQRWRATDNALESIAAQHSDSLLILDELSQVDPKTAGECAYLLANEQGKARASRNGTARPRQTWRLLFLSTGELGLADHMATGQRQVRTGQELRMVDVQAETGAGLGVFENLHGYENGATFANHLTTETQHVYGSAGIAWLEWLTQNADSLRATIRGTLIPICKKLVAENSSGQVERVAARFGLVAAAGELATKIGLTGWQPGESEWAARVCFNSWLVGRGGDGNAEIKIMVRQVQKFLAVHGDARFSSWHRSGDDHAPKTLQRAGVKRMLGANGLPIKTAKSSFNDYEEPAADGLGEEISFEYYILSEVFRSEVCAGFDHSTVAKILKNHKCLFTLESEGSRLTIPVRLPGIGMARCYKILPGIFSLDL